MASSNDFRPQKPDWHARFPGGADYGEGIETSVHWRGMDDPGGNVTVSVAGIPAGSRVECAMRGGCGLTLKVPAPGLGGRSFWIAVLWFVISGLPALFLWLLLHEAKSQRTHGMDYWFPLLFTGLLLVVCLLTAVSMSYLATRRVQLDVDAGALLVQFKGIIGTSRFEYARGAIRSIKIGVKYMGMCTRRSLDVFRKWPDPLQLKIITTRGTLCLGAHLTRDELLWIKSVLISALNEGGDSLEGP